ncbi:hypothetical protein BDR06DRAFT_967806 [Suillus hirtellus]|nr:hypothetical protein BDR06DRAFT_967806 [Suillus hirtellus]
MYPTYRSLKITSLEILIDALLGSSPPWSCTLHVSPNEGNGAMQDSPALVGEFDGDIFLASRRRHGDFRILPVLSLKTAYDDLPAFFHVLRTDCCNNNNTLEQEGAVLTGKVDYMFDVSENVNPVHCRSRFMMTVLVMSDIFERKRIKLADPSIERPQMLVKSSNVNVGLILAARIQITSVEPLFGPAAFPKLQASRQFCLVDSTLRSLDYSQSLASA